MAKRSKPRDDQQPPPDALPVAAEAPPPDEAGSATLGVLTKYEKYELVEVHRSQLKNAPYNPRQIGPKQKKKLRAAIAKTGLVEPLVWNARTGHIVGGHQRVGVLDSLEGTQDYRLHVAKIDVDLKAEKELNVLLNNQAVQGEWDLSRLEEMFRDESLEIANTGFDVGDVYRMFGDAPMSGRSEELSKLSEEYRKFREKHEQLVGGLAVRDDHNFFRVVVFQDGTAAQEFCRALGLPEEDRHLDGRELLKLLKPDDLAAAQADYSVTCDYCDTLNSVTKGQAEVVCRMCKKTFPCTWDKEKESADGAVQAEVPPQAGDATGGVPAGRQSGGVDDSAGVPDVQAVDAPRSDGLPG